MTNQQQPPKIILPPLRVEPELKALLQARADHEHRSLSAMRRECYRRELERHTQEEKS